MILERDGGVLRRAEYVYVRRGGWLAWGAACSISEDVLLYVLNMFGWRKTITTAVVERSIFIARCHRQIANKG